MDLVLLKPGNEDLFVEGAGSSQLDGEIVSEDGTEEIDGCIELVSCNFGMSQQMTTDVSNTARTSGRPNLMDITCVKYLDRSSPNLYKHCLSAQPIDTGEIEEPTKIFLCRNSGEDGEDNVLSAIMTIKLYNCMISSVQAQSHPNDMATEQLMLNFTDIEWIATHQSWDASPGGIVAFQWSVARNRSNIQALAE